MDGAYLYANLHNFKTCITFDLVGILRCGLPHFGFLITIILIIKSFKNAFEGSQDLYYSFLPNQTPWNNSFGNKLFETIPAIGEYQLVV